MKTKSVFFILLFGIVSMTSFSQNSEQIKKKFLSDLQSGDVEDGCKIVVYVVNAAANAACYVPDPTISKVACLAAQVMNVGMVSELDPNIPHPVTSAGEVVCRLTYASTNAGITYTFEFAKNKADEIQKTWNWLNSLDGAIQFMYYMSN
ncbi:hypothetical protein [Flavobacterium sp.]|uniref:hypothetical protein n=1 Tax=Flavobacterium sp. TaxID=239 RepID=UPI0025C0D088|nr:hypothetical protein [Flavobacterium sp.]